MGLADRLKRANQPAGPAVSGEPTTAAPEIYHTVKADIHKQIIDKLDLEATEKLGADQLRVQLESVVTSLVSSAEAPLNRSERDRMSQELLDDVTGLGPLEPLLRDTTISDILVNCFNMVFVERRGRLELSNARFRDNEHVLQVINRIVSRVGRRIDETSPMVDARLPDGSRVNAIIPPLAVDGPIVSIRRFGANPLKVRDLLTLGSTTPEMLGFIGGCVRAKLNILLTGGTGTGKTTLLNALSLFIKDEERVVTIEDAAELQLQRRHVVRLETRPANIEGKGEVVARDLVRNSLRMRPDRIIVGEVRGSEVLDMLQAMNTGHEGSMATMHANAPRDALSRLESMIGMSGVPLSEMSMRQIIARAINIMVHLTRGPDGRRRITSVSEITGIEGSVITMQELYRFEQTGIDREGKVQGRFIINDIRPRSFDRFEAFGVNPAELVRPFVEG